MPPFKHGTIQHGNGNYPVLTAGPHRSRYVHGLVAEGMLGRKLSKDEHVHHKDGDTRNPHEVSSHTCQ
jgi:hypothetical protein